MEKFSSVKEMVNYLIDNEGHELGDRYGRRWVYRSYEFYFKDINPGSEYTKGFNCFHLFATIYKP